MFTENTSDKITHDYALSVSSQFLNTYRTVKDAAEKNTEQWRGGFLNPATLDFSYNVSIRFWEYSNVMLGLSAIRILTRPRYEGAVEPKETPFAKTERSFILGYYGMSGEVNVYAKKISENISWDNNSSFFVNGISRDRVSFDFQNNVSFKFLKYLQFRLESQITYDPLHSYHLQYRQEFLVGIFYEQKK